MRSVVKFSIKQTVFINVVFVILVVAGVFSLFTVPMENMPPVDIGRVMINTVYFGASAHDVEQLVTTKIEDALNGLENVEYIQSNSYRNFSSIDVKFIDDSDYRFLYDELRFRVMNIKDELPDIADDPTFIYVDTNSWLPVIIVNISGDLPQRSLNLYAEELRTLLINVSDVQDAKIEGNYKEEFHVSVDPLKLRRFGITFQQLVGAIQSANTKIPTGRFRKENFEYMLDAGKQLSSQKETLDVVVRRDGDGNFVRVRDLVTTARLSHRDPFVISSVNGDNTIRLIVTKENKGNAIQIAEEVKKLSKEFEALHQKDEIKVVFANDSTIEINDSLNILGGNLIMGMTLVTIILWLTLGFRNAMLTAAGIPFSFLVAIIIVKITGLSVNTISLFSFVLVTGIIVDDAVIIIENIFRHFEMGKTKREAVLDGTSEVMLPVISSALTTVLAFLPMLIMTGMVGEFFAVIPKTVTFALVASLVEAIFILPIHFLDWGPKRTSPAKLIEETNIPFQHLKAGLFAPFWKIYQWTVEKLLDHKLATFLSITTIFALSLAIFVLSVTGIVPFIKVKFFPGNYFRYHVAVIMPVGTTIEKTDTIVRDISKFIMELGKNQALSAAGIAGYYEDEDYVRYDGSNLGEIIVMLPEKKNQNFPENPKNDPMEHLNYIRRKLNVHITEKYKTTPFVKVFPENDGPPTGTAVNIRVMAPSMKKALDANNAIIVYMKKNPEFDALINLDDDKPSLYKTFKYKPKQEAVFEYGLNSGDVTGLTAGALNGWCVGSFRTEDEEIDILVRIARFNDIGNIEQAGFSSPSDVLNLSIIEDSDSPVLLRDVVDISYEAEPNISKRYNGKPTITIKADIEDGSKLSPARVQFLVKKHFGTITEHFPGVSLSFGGEFESTSKSYTSLTFAFFIALLGIYMVLSSQFDDYFQPLIILSAVPFALIGVVMGLFITRTTFTLGSFLAIVGLAGIAVNDALLLIDFMNVRRKNGAPLREAIIEACAARMRPVCITTVTTMLGLLPMAIGIPNKSISWAPMATAFVAGLSSATFLTLLIVPVNYEFFEQFKSLCKRKKQKLFAK